MLDALVRYDPMCLVALDMTRTDPAQVRDPGGDPCPKARHRIRKANSLLDGEHRKFLEPCRRRRAKQPAR